MYINELSLNLTSSCITSDVTTPEKNNIRMLQPIWLTLYKSKTKLRLSHYGWQSKEWKGGQTRVKYLYNLEL